MTSHAERANDIARGVGLPWRLHGETGEPMEEATVPTHASPVLGYEIDELHELNPPPTGATPYGASPTKLRRTKSDMDAIRTALYDVLAADNPMTVRQVFYRLVSQGVIAKTEDEYKRTVGRLLTEMRLDGDIPFGWIADNTRWQRKPISYFSLEHALRATAATYRRAIWHAAPVYVEVWLEKDALAGVLLEETAQWDVPLMVTRGYASVSYLHEAAQHIAWLGKPTYLYYFGDYDPSGVDITRNVEARLRQFAPDAPLHFERVAVTPAQIRAYDLPTRPTKTADSRSGRFAGDSVEVDALPVEVLRQLVRDCIAQHLDNDALVAVITAEVSEREVLETIIQTRWGNQ